MLQKLKNKRIAIMSALMVCMMSVNAFASTADPALISAFESTQGQILANLLAVAPIALVIMGTFLSFRYGVRFFKALSK